MVLLGLTTDLFFFFKQTDPKSSFSNDAQMIKHDCVRLFANVPNELQG